MQPTGGQCLCLECGLVWDIHPWLTAQVRPLKCRYASDNCFSFTPEQLRIFAHLKKLVRLLRPSDSLKLVREILFHSHLSLTSFPFLNTVLPIFPQYRFRILSLQLLFGSLVYPNIHAH